MVCTLLYWQRRHLDMNIVAMTDRHKPLTKGSSQGGFSLAEVVMAVFVSMLLFGGMITAYTNVTRNAQWSGYSLAAQALAIQQVEQAHSAVWDPTDNPPKNEISNMMTGLSGYAYSGGVLSGYSWTNLDLPVNGGNYVRATNYVTLSTITPSAGVTLQVLQVNTVWPFRLGNATAYYTNTVVTYLAPDNRDPDTL
jgi:hypothetical protein